MNKPAIPEVSKEEILKLMEYNPDLGLIWKIKRGRFGRPGLPVGGATRSQIRLGGVRVYSSHIVWFLHHGYWPSEKGIWIDHRDGNLSEELISDLRAASPSQNKVNSKVGKNNKLGIKGIHERQGKFDARIQFNGKLYFLGLWETIREAEAAYIGASKVLHGEFSYHNRNGLLEQPEVVKLIIEKEHT